jgi:hypothetical protein
MSPLLTGILRSLFLVVMLTAIVFRASVFAAQAGEQHALLIGINNYQQLPTLNGALNDVEVMRDLIVHRYGFDPANVTVLTDNQATREGILQALNSLASRAGPSDTVYIHYSGHGSQVEDLSGDEEDGLDETICPQDARTPDVPDITDDEIDEIVSKFRTPRVFIVMDSCHSGTGLRSATSNIRVRSVPRDERTYLYKSGPKNVLTRAVVKLPQTERYVLITGAAANQNALDGPFANGRYHGLLSYALEESLSRLPEGATPLQLKEQIDRQISGMQQQLEGHPVPDPQLEGPSERLNQPFLGMKGQSRESHASAEKPGRQQTSLFLDDIVEALQSLLPNSSNLQLDFIRVPQEIAPGATTRYRGISFSNNQPPEKLVFYQPGSGRTPRNSLQVEVRSVETCYLTLVYVDSRGGLQVIFPDPDQKNDFYPEGRIPGDLAVRLPDSLLDNNRAGYHWDYGPPAGQDTVIAFCTTDRIKAKVLRTGIEEVATGAESDAIKALGHLSAQLSAGYSGMSNRGIRVSQGGTGQQQREAPEGKETPAPGWGMAKILLDIDK